MATKRSAGGEVAPSKSRAQVPVAVVNPTFKWAVIINCVICTATLVIMVCLALFSSQDKLAEKLFFTCEKVFTLTAGAFIGLLGGKASGPDKQITANH
jgi:hypothetical protein